MHGIGNDYVYFDCDDHSFGDLSSIAVTVSDRHRSVGGDGAVFLFPSERADVRMRMFNADGSEGKMCGNAVRCVAKYLRDVRGLKQPVLTVETVSGVKTVTLSLFRGEEAFTVDMGTPVFDPKRIPTRFPSAAVGVPLEAAGEIFTVTCLSMGNPHCVVFCGGDGELDALDLEHLGPIFEHHPVFPERTNTEFVSVVGKNELCLRVWERGSGETLACGTGACAATVAAVLAGLAARGEEALVHLAGGDLGVVYGESVKLTGPATIAFFGEIDL